MTTRLRQGVLCIFLVAVLCGCSTVKLSDADRAATHTVAVVHSVEMPPHIFYHGPGQIISSGFGVIGAAIARGTAAPTESKLEQALDQHGVSVADILAANFEQQLVSSNLFTVIKDRREADAAFYFKIQQYGIIGGITEPLHGMLFVEASLTNKAGKVIWRNVTRTEGDSRKIPDIDFDELIKDGKRLTQAFENPSVRASQKLIKTLAPKK
jgi:hypothetical protein